MRPGEGIGFRRFPPFSLPFLLLASPKGIGFRLVSLFSLPFRLNSPGKSSKFWQLPLFSLPFRQPHVSLTSPKTGRLRRPVKPNSISTPTQFPSLSSIQFRHPADLLAKFLIKGIFLHAPLPVVAKGRWRVDARRARQAEVILRRNDT